MSSVERRFVNFDEIITDRELLPEDDISDLAENIYNSGLQVPILLDDEMRLIDGLRRMEAVRSLGGTVIEATIVSTYSDACVVIDQARKHAQVDKFPVRRIWELSQSVKFFSERERALSRRGSREGRVPKGNKERHERRRELAKALGFGSQSRIQAICFVYRIATYDPTEKGNLARQLIPELETGTTSPWVLRDKINGSYPHRLDGDITNAAGQRAALKVATANLAGIVQGLSAVGPPHRSLSRKEKEEYIKALSASRTSLSRFIRLFRGGDPHE